VLKCYYRVILVTVCSALFIVSVQAQSPPPPPPPARDYPIAEWKTFTSQAWEFSVLLPTTPAEETRVVKNTKQHFFKSFMSQHTFQISCYESEGERASLETAADGLRKMLLRGETSKVLRDEKISQGGAQGRELTVAISNAIPSSTPGQTHTFKSLVHAKIFAVERRVYLLIATSLSQEAETKEGRAFLDSFKLTDAPPEKKVQPNNSKPN